MLVLHKGWFHALLLIGIPIIIMNCGLPDYAAIEAPTLVESPLENKILAFQTPTDTTNIIGYMLYYKIYSSFGDYEDTGKSDKNYFDPISYTNGEIPSGETVPKQKGFFKMGQFNYYSLGKYLIPQNAVGGGNINVYIDFSNLSDTVIPGAYLNTKRSGSPLVQLVRGIRDSRANTYLLEFYNNWEFYDNDSDNYEDSDMLRNNNTSGLLQYQPVYSSTDYENIRKVAAPLTEHSEHPLSEGSDLHIAIVVHSYGQDFESGKLQDLTSIPVYLGYVIIEQVSDLDSTGR